jgi:hypothetical protein
VSAAVEVTTTQAEPEHPVVDVKSGDAEIARPFVEKIGTAHVRGVEAIMNLADALIEARKALKPRGLYYRIFSDTKDPLPGCSVSMSSSTADKITSIRERKALSDPSTWKGLPSSWTTLYELTDLSVADVRRLVKERLITPDLSVKEAHSLVLDLYPREKPAAPKPSPPIAKASQLSSAPPATESKPGEVDDKDEVKQPPDAVLFAPSEPVVNGIPMPPLDIWRWRCETENRARLWCTRLAAARRLGHPNFAQWLAEATAWHVQMGAVLDLLKGGIAPAIEDLEAILDPDEDEATGDPALDSVAEP